MPDTLWVALARKCVLFHSELIWERIKGALGVPPELDIDYNLHSDILSSSASSIDTDDISDDHGRSARGHWDDWDAVMDSPVFDRRHSSASTSSPPNFHTRPTAEHPTSLLETRLSSSPPKSTWDSDSPASSFLSIEPILVPTCPSTLLSPTAPPPFSLSTSETTGVMGLGDIQESAEDDAETEISSPNENDPTKDTPNEGDPDLISPTQIQGLRISTTPLNPASTESPNLLLNLSPIGSIAPPNSSSSLSSYVAPPPVSPLPPYPSTGTATARPSSRSSSISSIGAGSFRRSGSWGSLSAALGSSLAGLPRNDEGGYNPVGDRAPGNPLFPSNFASLAVGPTLVANNPTLRSPPLPPQSRYSTNLSAGLYRSVHGHGQKQRTYSHSAAVGSSPGRGTGNTDVSRRQSWGHGSRGGGGNDYAVSVTSVESAGE
ncbi:hypothetical protein L208DRAFT_1374705 [Tricholoma matsutake]|nr:hypothetical protein L208DRAFT_1374705 [Tricholoma matsutake 945]